MAMGGEGADLHTEYGTIQCVSEYIYLDVGIRLDRKKDKVILSKVARGKRIIRRLRCTVWNKDITTVWNKDNNKIYI